MSEISAAMVKQLREKSGAGIMDCKHALAECDGDIEKSIDYLRKKGLATAKKRAGRATKEGAVQAYIHMGGKIGYWWRSTVKPTSLPRPMTLRSS